MHTHLQNSLCKAKDAENHVMKGVFDSREQLEQVSQTLPWLRVFESYERTQARSIVDGLNVSIRCHEYGDCC